MHPPPDLLIAGASTRAAAFSALRAGLQPVCADLFADADLRRVADVIPTPRYPQGLSQLRHRFPGLPWMYAGGLENHPRLVARISEAHPLWGNGPDALRRARNPRFLFSLLRDAGLPALETRRGVDPPNVDGNWMLKPRRGSGGRGISRWTDVARDFQALREPHVFQEYREGLPISALYLATPGETLLLGITRQLIGLDALYAPEFAWCGSTAPQPLDETQRHMVQQIGQTVAAGCGLRGLFGCDYILAEYPWLTEVNPRYPASTEIHEHLLQRPLIDWHRRACAEFESKTGRATQFVELSNHLRRFQEHPPQRTLGKAILYAPRDVTVVNCGKLIRHSTPQRLPLFSDVPDEGAAIPQGIPICTMFATAPDAEDCLRKLLQRAARFAHRHFLPPV